eukprot:TRINITY_DN2157_c0_g1_i1.p1 TRINITY_DN2157_c0_g1~~TRINITY_DN2157_c0_g1_i1.p1  ORF type:complete len:283 (+),score=123.82 TRINITY_DN2157_c0_g1_i1:43-891(+)
MAESHQELLETAILIAKTAGVEIREAFLSRFNQDMKSDTVEFKDRTDLVTETDKGCEKKAIETIKAKYPHHEVLGEESVSSGEMEYKLGDATTWIIDPVDGTTNFVHGIPWTCISIAVAVNKELVVGVVYNAILDELFTATKAGGAFLNNKPIKVSGHSELHHALVATGFPTDRSQAKVDYITENIRAILPHIRDFRRLGSAALDICSVACGRLDAYFELHIHAWDIAAGVLILQEAGGMSVDPSGAPLDLLCGRALCTNNKSISDGIVKHSLPVPKGIFNH